MKCSWPKPHFECQISEWSAFYKCEDESTEFIIWNKSIFSFCKQHRLIFSEYTDEKWYRKISEAEYLAMKVIES